jgi:hypothetical protein
VKGCHGGDGANAWGCSIRRIAPLAESPSPPNRVSRSLHESIAVCSPCGANPPTIGKFRQVLVVRAMRGIRTVFDPQRPGRPPVYVEASLETVANSLRELLLS